MEISTASALVTGGSEGIGLAIAAALRAKGARVAIMARRREPLEAAAARIGALAIPGDVGIEADARRAVETTLRELGGLDILVNNAGYGYHAPLVEIDREAFDRLFATNVTGAMLMAREAARVFIEQRHGHLVNIASTSGLRGSRGSTAYAATKFALRGMSECWRDELRRHNVRVMLVNPSEVQTGFFAKEAGGRRDGSSAGQRETAPASKPDTELDPRKLRPEEIAAAIVGALEIDDRGFIPELSVWATNPF